MTNHSTSECFKKRGSNSGNGRNDRYSKRNISKQEEMVNAIVSKSVRAAMKQIKGSSKNDSNSDDELNNIDDINMYDRLPSHIGKKQKKAIFVPQMIGTIASQLKANPMVLRVLIDSGCTSTIMLEKYGKQFPKVVEPKSWKTEKGIFTTTHNATVKFKLPELCRMKEITWPCYVNAHADPRQANYDMIIGLDLQQELGLTVDNENLMVHWGELTAPMKEKGSLNNTVIVEQLLHTISDEPSIIKEAIDRRNRLLDAKYEAANIDNVVKEQGSHLTTERREQLRQLLKDFEHLFDGTLGDWKTEPVAIELKAGVTPFKRKPYQVAKINESAFKHELDRLCKIKVLKRCGPSAWASPSTVIPKKDNRVRFISDFRGLNARIKRKSYPLPKISDLMQKLEGFTYATALDLNMGYFTIRLDKNAQDLCTIVTPWGNYRYLRLPLGLANSPDIFQDRMSYLMIGLLEFAKTYLDDILVMSKGSFEDHLQKLREVFKRLSMANLKVNVTKSKFCQTEVEYLGFWITRDGIQPLPRKVDAIMRIARPANRKQLRSFIGLVNYYRDMWRHRSAILAPLSKATSKNQRWKWTAEMQQAFDKIKAMLSKEVLLSYPDFSKPFNVYTDASDVQLGAVIVQEKWPLAFYSLMTHKSVILRQSASCCQ
ncbi:MAG: reverse transcriptase domain-containing protein [bacterium]